MKIKSISNLFCAAALSLSLFSFSNANADTTADKGKKNVKFAASLFQVQGTSKVKLAIDNDSDRKLNIYLKDKSGMVYYTESVGQNEEKYRRVFDLETMADGVYTFEITSVGGKITKEIQLKTDNTRFIAVN
ncbi:hypothetical protein DYBT9275_00716 [Dyadobacter sp. CECT 9275]|uniref:Por secretion system C-terminal sorting domain-containing protein n=1 Tax=Dyadobacter helix TaxID=2822344 RepID=A0A916JAM0_9BACT|nr:hypothetical protein [Dyadobacter sp. CECT 9275]CAG4991271.1 hypothetical protein DYBT9275_00716 [Dyadobacter sp. CECT 9275]